MPKVSHGKRSPTGKLLSPVGWPRHSKRSINICSCQSDEYAVIWDYHDQCSDNSAESVSLKNKTALPIESQILRGILGVMAIVGYHCNEELKGRM